MNQKPLQKKLEMLPDHLKAEVSDFIEFLLDKLNKQQDKKTPQFGSGKGFLNMAPDFDAPLDDFKEYMEWVSWQSNYQMRFPALYVLQSFIFSYLLYLFV